MAAEIGGAVVIFGSLTNAEMGYIFVVVRARYCVGGDRAGWVVELLLPTTC